MILSFLQSVHETPCSDATLQLEKLVARAVRPYLGLLGVYYGKPEPEIRSNFKIPPQIYVLGMYAACCYDLLFFLSYFQPSEFTYFSRGGNKPIKMAA